MAEQVQELRYMCINWIVGILLSLYLRFLGVTSLVFYWSEITMSGLRGITSGLMSLKSLMLEQTVMESNVFCELMEVLKQCSQIVSLKIINRYFTSADTTALADYIRHSNIDSLSINSGISGNNLQPIINAIESVPLQSLDLTGNYFREHTSLTFSQVLAKCTDLTTLRIGHIWFRPIIAFNISEFLKQSKVKTLSIKHSSSLRGDNFKTLASAFPAMKLQSLELFGNELECDDIGMLLTTLECCHDLETLAFCANRISFSNICGIMALCIRRKIKSLNLEMCHQGNRVLQVVSSALADCPHLKSLNISANGITTNSDITYKDVEKFANAVAMSSLEHLDLSCNDLDYWARPILEMIPSSKLKSLNLSYTGIKPKIIPDVFTYLAKIKHEIQIDIGFNHIDPGAMEEFSKSNPHCTIKNFS